MNRHLLFTALLLLAAIANATEFQGEQGEVWDRELAYWAAVEARDLPTYLELWHPKFVGWPCSVPEPETYAQNEEATIAWFRDLDASRASYEVFPQAVVVSDDIALAYYWVRKTSLGTGGERTELSLKFVHTWKRVDDTWLILGGMCAPLGVRP